STPIRRMYVRKNSTAHGWKHPIRRSLNYDVHMFKDMFGIGGDVIGNEKRTNKNSMESYNANLKDWTLTLGICVNVYNEIRSHTNSVGEMRHTTNWIEL